MDAGRDKAVSDLLQAATQNAGLDLPAFDVVVDNIALMVMMEDGFSDDGNLFQLVRRAVLRGMAVADVSMAELARKVTYLIG